MYINNNRRNDEGSLVNKSSIEGCSQEPCDFSRGKFSFGMTIKTSKILDMLERHGWTFAPPEDEDDEKVDE